MPELDDFAPAARLEERQRARRPLRVLRRRFPIILTCVILTPLAIVGYDATKPTKYTATAQLLFRTPGYDQAVLGQPFFSPTVDPARTAATNLKLVSLPALSGDTAKRLGHGVTSADVSNAIESEQEGQADLVSINATDENKALAAAMANTFAEQFIKFRRDADRAKVIQARGFTQAAYDAMSPAAKKSPAGVLLNQRVRQLQTLAALQTGNAELVQRAGIPSSPSSPRPLRDGVVGIAFGLLLGLLLVALVERLDRRLRDSKEIEEIVQRPLLGAVPRSRMLSRSRVAPGALPPGEAEAFQMLRASLRYFNVDRTVRSVLITSAAPGDGKSTIAANLAFATADTGTKTLLIEADLRHPTVAAALGMPSNHGLTNLLASTDPLESAVRTVQVPGRPRQAPRTLDVIVSGPIPPNPTDLMESERLRQLIRDAESRYDFVVIDTPPTSVVSDAIPLITEVSGVIVVARLAKTTRTELNHLHTQLNHLNAPVLGVVVNSVGRDSDDYAYGYAYGAGYYGATPTTNGDLAAPGAVANGSAEHADERVPEPVGAPEEQQSGSGGLLGRFRDRD